MARIGLLILTICKIDKLAKSCSTIKAMVRKIAVCLLCAAWVAWGGAAVGTVTASGPVKISGSEIPATAVSSFPLSVGDQLSTMGGPAVARVGDRAVLRLEPRSTLRLEESGNDTIVRLLSGTLHYQVATDANIRVYALDEPAKSPFVGTVKVDRRKRKAAIIWLTAGGAAAVVATTALVRRSVNCPPDATDNGCGQ